MSEIYKPPIQTSRFQFNLRKWKQGRETENKLRPYIEKYFDCKFYRDDDDIDIDSIDPENPPACLFGKLDFKNDEKKIIVEVKGRTCSSYKFYETLLTCGKVEEAEKDVENGWEVYYLFKFTNKCKIIKHPDRVEWKSKITGTFNIPHYLIPVCDCDDFNISGKL